MRLRKKLSELVEERNQLQTKLKNVQDDCDVLNARVKQLEAEMRGERVCDTYCENCIHGIRAAEVFGYLALGDSRKYYCDIDCKCPDFARKER